MASSFVANQGTQTPLLVDTTGGTAGTVIAVQKLDISPSGTAGTFWQGGVTGTINSGSITVIAGTIASDTVVGGTINLATITGNLGTIGTIGLATVAGNIGVSSGTINVATIAGNLGTIGTLGLATVTGNLGTIGTIGLATIAGNIGVSSGTINVSTISSLPNTPGGTINLATVTGNLGTIGTIGLATINGNLGTIGTVGLATVSGNIGMSSGTLNLGTIVGKDANAAVQSGNPIAVAGTNSGGSIVTLQVDASGNLKTTGVANGTTVGTINVGTINTGTINTGTINTGTFVMPSGTLTTGSLSNVAMLNGGTINIGTVAKSIPASTSGSFTAAGSIVVAGSQNDAIAYDVGGTWVGTAFFEAQIGTSPWFSVFAQRQQDNALVTQFSGSTGFVADFMVDAGGFTNSRLRLTYSSGTFTYNAQPVFGFDPIIALEGGTITNIGMLNAGTISSLPNLPQGSINVTAGTIATLGTMGTLGLVNTVTTVSNVSNGSIHVTAGTEVITTGTMNTGTVNTGTVNTGTINVATVTAGTVNVGTFQINPLTATNTISHAGTSGTLVIGTLVGTSSIGVGTALYPTNFRIVAISGTPEVILAFGSQTNGNQVIHHGLYPAGGGIANSIPFPHGYGTTNSPLTYQILSGAGTVSWDVDYFVHT